MRWLMNYTGNAWKQICDLEKVSIHLWQKLLNVDLNGCFTQITKKTLSPLPLEVFTMDSSRFRFFSSTV